MLVGCGTPADPWPLTSMLGQRDGQTWRIAGVIVDDDTPFLTQYVVITPDNAPQLASLHIAITLTAAQHATIPWRDDHGVRYAPVIVTGVLANRQITNVSDISVGLSEATVATLPHNQLVRVIGLLNTHPDSAYLHDRANPAISRAFRPAWLLHTAPLRLAESAPLMIEGVRADDALIPLVIAPVTTH